MSKRIQYRIKNKNEEDKQTGEQPAVFVGKLAADSKNHIKKHFAVYGPADTQNRLINGIADVERDKEKAFDQLGDIGSGFPEHGREKEEQKKRQYGHKIIKRQNADQAFP